MAVPNPIEVYEEIKPALGEKAARDLLDFMQGTLLQNIATQSDMRELQKDTEANFVNLRKDMDMRFTVMQKDMESLRKEVENLAKQVSKLQTLVFNMFLALIGFWGTIILAIYLK